MLKRQESAISLSRCQAAATPPSETHRAKAIGCMSGIVQLFSKYQKPNKLLTFGRKREKSKQITKEKVAVPTKASSPSTKQDKNESQISCTKRSSPEITVPRSPTLPHDLRRSNAVNQPESPRASSSLVTRLMGLGDTNDVKIQVVDEEPNIAEKRRRLLQAIEKCNEDLEGLKRVMEAVRTVPQPPEVAEKRVTRCGDTSEVGPEELCPVCVLDEFTKPSLSGFGKEHNTGAVHAHQHRKLTATKKPGEDDDEPIAKYLLCNKSTIPESTFSTRRRAATLPSRAAAMVESVEQVCSDISWGEKREIGILVVVLQDYLWRDLIEEMIKELKSCCLRSLPLEACKRRLSF